MAAEAEVIEEFELENGESVGIARMSNRSRPALVLWMPDDRTPTILASISDTKSVIVLREVLRDLFLTDPEVVETRR